MPEAAKALAGGAVDILAVALEHGYGSHEAFTRAFRDWFGLTPETVRAQGSVAHLVLKEPLRMEKTDVKLAAPKMMNGGAMQLAGVAERYESGKTAGIPAQWQRFGPHVRGVAYGVCWKYGADGSFASVCAVETDDPDRSRTRVALPAQRYAAFRHDGHVSSIAATWKAIYTTGLGELGLQATDGPSFERYDASFDGQTRLGGVDIWVPVG